LRLGQHGRYISIISATPATLTLSIDDESPQTIVSGTQIDCEEARYSHLTFTNTGGAPSTLIALISNRKVTDMRGDALMAAMVASLAAIDIDTSGIRTDIQAGNVDLAALEVLVTAGNVDLAALEVLVTAGNVDLAALEALLIAATIAVSTDGGYEVLAPNATTAANGADQACRECMFWTADTHIHFKLGTTDADGNTTLLLANTVYNIPVHNTNHLRFYNGAAVQSTGINIIWRD
jgi:hypothetical protein